MYATATKLSSNHKKAIVNRTDSFWPILDGIVDIDPIIATNPDIHHHTNVFMKEINFPDDKNSLIQQIKKET